MDEVLMNGFSMAQLKGIHPDAMQFMGDGDYIKDILINGYPTSSPTIPSELNGDGVRGQQSARENGFTAVETNSTKANLMAESISQSQMETDGASNLRQSGEVMPIAIVGMSCRFPGGTNNLQDMRTLCMEGRSPWSEIPKTRFNVDAFYHPNAEKVDSMNVKSGHFMKEDQYGYFDASFFNISPNEAKAMDPRARLHLEGAYEAFENAGLRIGDLTGSNTSVFIGAFNEDYGQLVNRDPDIAPPYKVTGLGNSMLSNRISYWFDFKGPSLTMDSACSASTSALHLACQSLRTGSSTVSVVAGANIMLEPDIMLALSSLNFLSPDGRTYMFDQRANGYARGEGIGTLVLKPLCDALESNDPIHAVIRNTATNQDGRTPGITLPSMSAQRALIEQTYRQVGLDVSETDFFFPSRSIKEAHGTGTQAGDRTEAEALAKALQSSMRSVHRPLFVGSVKSLMGHCEGASGVAGVFHSVLALKEKCFLPNSNFEFPSDEINFHDWRLKVPTQVEGWDCNHPRRASLNSFGYGGTNVHAILEEAPPRIGSTNGHAPPSTPRKLIVLSAHEVESLRRAAHGIAEYTEDSEKFDDLVYTLGQRRSLLRHKLAIQSCGMKELGAVLKSTSISTSRFPSDPRICFVFTGQGAQWAQMGCELLSAYPTYRATLHAADAVVAKQGASWSLLDELSRAPKISKIGEACLSQPLCTAIQLGLIELLKSWGVRAATVVGHSSGEIAGAYYAGMLDLDSAMTVAYYRGLLAMEVENAQSGICGAMMAVGLPEDQIQPFLSGLQSGKASIACYNSPKSVTISGDASAIDELHHVLDNESIFNRVLRVGVAYHSHHMKVIAKKYAELLSGIKTGSANPDIAFKSSVFPGIILETNAEYWVQNMLSPVRFSEAMGKNLSSEASRPDIVIEVGPHSALAGPLKQISVELSPDHRPLYFSSLERKRSDIEAMLDLAGNLFAQNVNIDIANINFPSGRASLQVLTDLPTYAWNHTKRYWHEGRRSQNYHQRKFPPHDLLGTMTDDCSELDMRWTNHLRQKELPWLCEHTLNSEPIFPGAGYLAMAIEAARQKADMTETPIEGFSLREVSFSNALIIPDTTDGTEVTLLLEPLRESSMAVSQSWDTFRVLSYASDRKATEHCHGLISTSRKLEITQSGPETLATTTAAGDVYEGLIDQFKTNGINLGKTFQLVSRPSFLENRNTCHLRIPDTQSMMAHKYESPQVISTPVLDACLQVAVLSIGIFVHALEGTLLPTYVEELLVSKDVPSNRDYVFQAQGKTDQISQRDFDGEAAVFDQTQREVLSIKGCRFIISPSTKGNSRQTSSEEYDRCWQVFWKPDVAFLDQQRAEQLWGMFAVDPEEVSPSSLNEKAAFFCLRKAVDGLSQTDYESMLPHHQHYVDWARLRIESRKAGGIHYYTPDWETTDTDRIEATLKQADEGGAALQMTAQVGRRLEDIFHQKVDPLSVMKDNDLFDRFYEDLAAQDRAYSYAARYIDLATHKSPDLKILEIGAGTGSATSFILKALAGEDDQVRCSSYMFTDISAGFFEKARGKFAAWEEYLDFKTLNIENGVEAQGFEEEGYDLVVAANVLHATEKMEVTMNNVNRLMKPGGKLVLVEVTNLSMLSGALAFGLLPGWWRGVAEGRKHSPLLTETEWDSLLQRTGFDGLDLCFQDVADPEKYHLSTMVTSKRGVDAVDQQTEISVIYASPSSLPTARDIASQFQPELKAANLKDIEITDMFYIFVDDPDLPIVSHLSQEYLEAFQQLCTAARGLLWVTFGAVQETSNPEEGAVVGFVRVLRSECGSMKFLTLDLPFPAFPGSSAVESNHCQIPAITKDCFGQPTGNATDLEYAVRDGTIMIPRLIKDNPANEAVDAKLEAPPAELQPFWQADDPITLQMRHLGLLDSFEFKSDSRIPFGIGKSEVEITVESTALNFHDLMVATGQLADLSGFGVECSGYISNLGEDAQDLQIGQRVCAMASGCFGTHTRTSKDLVCAIPDEMDFEIAASIPSVFSTSYYSLHHAARLQPGETILIHSAAGGVGQACIKLASLIGAKIFVTVGTPSKVDFLAKTYDLPRSHIFNSRDLSFAPKIMALTEGKGVDVVINSLAGEALRETWKCIAMFGRFVELGKKDSIQNTKLGMAPFERSASFIAVGFDLFGAYRSTVPGKALRQVMDLFAKGDLKPITPITTYSIADIEKAFRFMQSGNHMGKIVINADHGCSVPIVPKPRPGLALRSDASYLIVGGLTGIGAAFAKFMVSNWGVTHLILLSRSGSNARGAAELIPALEAKGAAVEIIGCDVANKELLEAALENCSASFPPIRGVIQGAMDLQDSIFMNMTLDRFFANLDPKITGSRNLHEYFLSRQLDLDFFVMLSSIAGLNGNSSQSAYGAGNTYQDALAHHRVAMGLPALSIDVGLVTDAGWSAENVDRQRLWGLGNALPITTEHLLRLIEHNILSNAGPNPTRVPPQVAIGLKEIRPWDARYSHLAASQARSPAQQQLAAKEQVSVADRIAAAGSDRALLHLALLESFKQKVSRLLDLPLENVKQDESLSAHGVDSLVAVEIRNWLAREAEAKVPMSDVLNGRKTIEQMVQGMVKERLKE